MRGPRPASAQVDFDEVVVEFAPRPVVRLVVVGVPVPKTRASCQDEGVCLALLCRHNTTLEVTKRGGIRLNAAGYSSPDRSLRPRRRGDGGRMLGFERDEGFDERVIERLETTERNCALDEVEASPDGMTLDDIAERLGTRTRQRVEQIEKRALRKLKRECEREGIGLRDFLLAWRSNR